MPLLFLMHGTCPVDADAAQQVANGGRLTQEQGEKMERIGPMGQKA